MTGQNENLIQFKKETLSHLNIPLISDEWFQAEIAKADELVSYDIESMSMDELKNHARCSILIAHKERIRNLGTIGALKREIDRLKQANDDPIAISDATGSEMDKEIHLTLTMGDLVNIHDALYQLSQGLDGESLNDVSSTLDFITGAIVLSSENHTALTIAE